MLTVNFTRQQKQKAATTGTDESTSKQNACRTIKVALVDIDNCLIANRLSEMNHALIGRLKDGHYDEIWLFSGRTGTETWLHVLNQGKPHVGWKNQLIFSILEHLENLKIKVNGVSLPYDHSLKVESGQGYYSFNLNILEQKLIQLENFDSRKVLNIINDLSAEIDDRMCLELALSGDMSKEGQFKYFLSYLVSRHPQTQVQANRFEIDYFDDKLDNLYTVQKCFSHDDRVTLRCTHCDFTLGNQTSEDELFKQLPEQSKLCHP